MSLGETHKQAKKKKSFGDGSGKLSLVIKMLQGTERKTSVYKRIKEKRLLESDLIADYQTVERTFKHLSKNQHREGGKVS